MEAAVLQMVSVANTTPEKAAQYLQVTDGDVDQAVMLFFENDGADLTGGPSASTARNNPPASGVTNRGNSANPINLDDDNVSDDNDPEVTGFRKAGASSDSTFDADAEMARRMQEEMYGGGGQEAGIRAPIARQAETLLGPGADVGPAAGRDMEAAIQQRMYDMQRRRGQGFRQTPGIFNQQATSAIWNGEDGAQDRETLYESTGGASESSSKYNALARMFQPPWDLIYKGPWDSARDEGREEQKWLLVNIQDASVFACQALNRDLWKNPGVVDTVKENFIFMQYSKDDPRAEQYVQYYFQEHGNSDFYPHIAIVDPRTGERVKVWSRDVPTAPEFLMQLHEFLDRYSLSNDARNPVAKRKPETSNKKSVDQMSEDEMMAIALQESLASQNNEIKPPTAEDPDDLTRSISDLREPRTVIAEESTDNEQPVAPPAVTPFSLISSNNSHVEPGAGPDVTRIQFRHPAGRLIRRFAMSDTVRRIYEFLKAEPLTGKDGAEFELVSMGKNLMESVDTTIEQAGLKNGTIMVEYLEG